MQGGSAVRESLRAALEQAAPSVALPSTRVSLPAAARLLELPLQVGEAAVC
ncbi:MAG TPA: hypothetical protein VIW29_20065 [Polyangiaceae bacterium]